MEITSLDQLDLTKQYSCADYLKWRLQERIELIRGLDAEGRYVGQHPYTTDESISPTIFPELTINLQEIFAE